MYLSKNRSTPTVSPQQVLRYRSIRTLLRRPGGPSLQSGMNEYPFDVSTTNAGVRKTVQRR